MNLLAPISTIMTTEIHTANASDSLTAVGELFDKHSIHHIPVIEENKLVGMISKSDFLLFKRGFYESRTEEKYDQFRLRNHTARDIMTKGIAKLEEDDKINVALEVFKKNFLHALPVLRQEKLVGIVTAHDIIKHLADDKSAINQYILS